MNKKLATAIVLVMLAALAGLVIAATVTYKSLGTIKAEYTEMR